MKSIHNDYRKLWNLSLFSFILAALTGYLYRYGLLYPLPGFLDLVNVRHAHSHLMFFNWISPPIMIWIVTALSGQNSDIDHRSFKFCLYSMIGLGFLSYPFFLLYGYRSVSLGPAELPVAAIISGFIMITWYWFAWLYFTYRKKRSSGFVLQLFDGALTALIVSSFGAWGVSVVQFSGIENPLFSSALTHFFLAVFTEGWAILGVLGIIWYCLEPKSLSIPAGWLWQPVLIGSMLIFPFGLTQSLVTPLMLFSAKAGLILIILSFLLHLYIFLGSKKFTGWVWKTILGLISLKILFQTAAIYSTDLWPGEHGLRILYLHLLLLGIISITLFRIFSFGYHRNSVQLFTASVLLVIGSLFLISGYSPAWFGPNQSFQIVMYSALLPIFPAGWILIKDLF